MSKPARYTGGEWNAVVKDWDGTPLRVVLAFPDIYEIGMSNLGLAILYDILNRQPDVLCERAFAPWTDMEEAMRQAGIPLFSLETRHALTDFDVIGFSLGYELSYTNVLNMLDLAGLPPLAAQRRRALPLVIAGGSGALNPEPLADFIDAFALGDGEELALDILERLRRFKAGGGRSKMELLGTWLRWKGCTSPASTASAMRPTAPSPRRSPPTQQRRPPLESGSSRSCRRLPPARSCPSCRRSTTGRASRSSVAAPRAAASARPVSIYRPRLERSVEEVVEAARELLANTGYRELSLVSLSTTDHSQIVPMVRALRHELGEDVSISLPSLRVDSFSVEVAKVVAGPGRHAITFAPEAGSQRLRLVINKLLTDEDVLQAAEVAFSCGWTGVKLYFMVGLPTETLEDVQGIVQLAARVKEIGRRYHRGRARVRVSTSTFIPKPHSSFQWARQSTAEELAPKHELLRRGCKRAGVEFAWEDPEGSLLEAVLSRGDRRLGQAILRAWQLGCRFDAWHEHLDWGKWQQALAECGLDPSFYAHREPGLFEKLPWSHIDVGVSEAYPAGRMAQGPAERVHPRLSHPALQRLRGGAPGGRGLPGEGGGARPAAAAARSRRRGGSRTAPTGRFPSGCGLAPRPSVERRRASARPAAASASSAAPPMPAQAPAGSAAVATEAAAAGGGWCCGRGRSRRRRGGGRGRRCASGWSGPASSSERERPWATAWSSR